VKGPGLVISCGYFFFLTLMITHLEDIFCVAAGQFAAAPESSYG
jgi:hypothetical protein